VAKNPNIKLRDDGVTMYFDHKLPNQIPRGHKSHRSGAGVHGQRKKVRIRGNAAKRAWLQDD
jgi:hypothetical protein